MTKRPIDREPRSYVIRVYRRTARLLTGAIEDVRSGRTRSFQSMHELWSAIGGPMSDTSRREP